jgi:hypothetical protein
MVRNKMSENIKNASQLVEQGHVRIGTEVGEFKSCGWISILTIP